MKHLAGQRFLYKLKWKH